MPRKEKAADGSYSPETKEKIRAMAATINRGRMANAEGDFEEPERLEDSSVEGLVRWACARNDGWVRIVPDVEGGAWWKWRFTTGRWAGRYILYHQKAFETAATAFCGLASKARAVDEGRLTPSMDVYS